MLISDINIKVDRDTCFACGVCVDRCIMDNLRLSVAPCRSACPLHMNCQGYIRLIAQGKEEQAAEEMRKYTPFGGVLGRICSQPCEEVCERQKTGDGAVHIRALKRYLADSYPDIAYRIPDRVPGSGRRAAVVGSGPAGLMAAYELRLNGHAVTVYEADPEPGGLLRYGIPSFRISFKEIENVITMLEKMGVHFKTGEAIGKKVELNYLENNFDAIVMAVGASTPRYLSIPGEDSAGVIQALNLLKEVNQGQTPQVGESILVIGGGNVAADASLVCRKLGAKDVKLICIERRHEMPAFYWELQEAEEEGVYFENGWGPLGFTQTPDGKMEVEFSRCLSLRDKDGNFKPELEDHCELTLKADTIVLAIGQKINMHESFDRFYFDQSQKAAVDGVSLQTLSNENIFICGDALNGPSTVVEAMASGKEAACSADRFLHGEGLKWGRNFWNGAYIKDYNIDEKRAKGGARGPLRKIPVHHRTLLQEAEIEFSGEQAKAEAQRCLSCGRAVEFNNTCWSCLPCEIECPSDALQVRMPYLLR